MRRALDRYDRFLQALIKGYFRLCPLPFNKGNIATALKSIAEAAEKEGEQGVAVGAAQLATAYRMAGPMQDLLH